MRTFNIYGRNDSVKQALAAELAQWLSNRGDRVKIFDAGSAPLTEIVNGGVDRQSAEAEGFTVCIGLTREHNALAESFNGDILYGKLSVADIQAAISRVEREADESIQQLVRIAPWESNYHVWCLRRQMLDALWLQEIGEDYLELQKSTLAQIEQLLDAWGYGKPLPLSAAEAYTLADLMNRAIAYGQLTVPRYRGGDRRDVPLSSACKNGLATVQLRTKAFEKAA